MNRIDWFERYAPGLQALTLEEREAISDFSFLWTMFEGRVLNTRASSKAIFEASRQWARSGLLRADTFRREIAYLRDRYVEDGKFTYHFKHLHLRRNDSPELVKNVLAGEADEPEEIVATVLIIVLRLRNNLFHGVKWSYELQGQLGNFTCANTALMKAIELDEQRQFR